MDLNFVAIQQSHNQTDSSIKNFQEREKNYDKNFKKGKKNYDKNFKITAKTNS